MDTVLIQEATKIQIRPDQDIIVAIEINMLSNSKSLHIVKYCTFSKISLNL